MPRRLVTLGAMIAALAQAAVTRVEVTERADTPVAGYERIAGKLHFALDPKLPANEAIVDLALAPKNAQGLVEFSADFLVLRAKDPAKSNGTALFEVVNRGRGLMWGALNRGANANMRTAQDFGDNFLLAQGYTLVWVGWQFDAGSAAGTLKVDAPLVPSVTGPVRVEILPNQKQTSDALPYAVADASSGRLTVRAAPYGPRTEIPKSQWRYSADQKRIEYPAGFEPGRIYEFVYTAKDPVVGGVGMAAIRDYISYIKQKGVAQPGDVKRAIGFGISQSGRFLRTFLYDGFNADEQGKQVFEGVWAHVAGGGHGGFNQRFVQPGRTTGQFTGSFYATDQAPFTPGELLAKAAGAAPKVILTNGSHEYWGRAAGLNHVSPDGSRDVDPPANVRIYYVAGTQHGGGGGGANPQVQNRTNSMEWAFFMRATMTSMNAWITNNTAPPASQFPRMDRGQLVPVSSLNFPAIPNFAVVNYAYAPRRLEFGPEWSKGIAAFEPPQAGPAYPAMVPRVDADGNEVSGVRLPELRVPLATYTGWNLRHPSVGAPDQQFSLIGSMAAFARTKAEREKTGDPRLSMEERYPSRADYLSKVEAAARELAGQRFLLESDIANVVALAGRHWDQYTAAPAGGKIAGRSQRSGVTTVCSRTSRQRVDGRDAHDGAKLETCPRLGANVSHAKWPNASVALTSYTASTRTWIP